MPLSKIDSDSLSAPLTVPAGSAAAPAITTTGDTNTGIFFPAADAIAFSEGGAEAMRIDSDGDVGIGTTSPGSKLTVVSTGNTAVSITGKSTAAAFSGATFWDGLGGGINISNSETTTNAPTSIRFTQQGASDTAAGIAAVFSSISQSNLVFCTNNGGVSVPERMRIDSSGNVGIGTSSPNYLATLYKASLPILQLANSTSGSTAADGLLIYLNGANATISNEESGSLIFQTSGTERARIDSSGNLMVGTTTNSPAGNNVVGAELQALGSLQLSRDGGAGLQVNRKTDDGEIVAFRQGGTQEGSISVSGTTVSYNGGHLSRWAQTTAPKDDTLVKGTVLSNLDEMNVYTDADGNPIDNEQLNKVKVSDVEGDANVAGVFVNWTHDDAHDVDEINMAMTGDMIIRVAQGTTVARGDLLMSAGDGTAKPQGDDIVRSKTVAKVTSTHVTCTYADGSFCVPCVLMAC
jgi:hypothetical protein